MRRQLAPAGIGNGRDIRQVRCIEQHHVGAIGGQGAARHRPRQNAGQLDDSLAGKGSRPGIGRRQRNAGRIADPLDQHGRHARQSLTLRMGIPIGKTSQRSHHQTRLRCRIFKGESIPVEQCTRDLLAACLRALWQRQQPQHAIAMVFKICMKTDPAPVGAGVQACDRVPGLRRGAVQ